MPRPIYQTSSDAARELGVLKAISAEWDVDARQTHKLNCWDGSIFDWQSADLLAIAEVKNRTCTRTAYEDYMISAMKVRELRREALQRETIPLLFVSWKGSPPHWIDLRHDPDRGGVGGRYDRGDRMDEEQMAYYRIDRFRPIFEVPHEVLVRMYV